ncbi:MAG: cytochrome c oxidase subunit 3 [Thermoanaerobaculales bacterium]|jgi:cytochrome c oxidase subunit 3|nr:cytochrome c oxidase subunit 3 [Thermoanaerobaculales bacterium]
MGAQHHGDGHDPNLAHHFESADQQYQSAKLGMWVFLMTEILFFGGLFVAYTVYRVNHPEVFVFGAHFLDTALGALNTVVLIFSSFTMAWAVRAAQLKQIKLLKWLIIATMLCAFTFMGVKYVEYGAKWKHGLLWAAKYDHHVEHVEDHGKDSAMHEETPAIEPESAEPAETAEAVAAPVVDPDRSAIGPAAEGPHGLAVPEAVVETEVAPVEPANAKVFFSIYFLMTGLHGIHVLGGIAAMLWLLKCLARGDFDGGHFTRVDMVALYWHVVDLVWIYLFLLLYLID